MNGRTHIDGAHGRENPEPFHVNDKVNAGGADWRWEERKVRA
jgi:hypothetical protein